MQATYTSFYFFCFFAVALILYYACPVKARMWVLSGISICFYLLTGNGILVLFPIFGGALSYAMGLLMEKRRKTALTITLVGLLGALVVYKYVHLGVNIINSFSGLFAGNPELIKLASYMAPLGISFYTFSLLSYVIDVYNGIIPPEKSFIKIFAYGVYFPTMLSGPILKYRESSEKFFEDHVFSYKRFTFGLQRMLWGLFKILVISERCRILVDTVYNSPDEHEGLWIIIASLLYAVTLYTNFSGCMDMVLGMSSCFGIELPENFDTPFLARTISEYWRRWHITLGTFMKEYVFYPVLRTKSMTKLASKSKKKFGKKKGKIITNTVATFVLWLTVGVWHGGDYKYIIGSGLLHWVYITLEEIFDDPFKKLWTKLNVNPENGVLNALRVVRTFILVDIGFVFFRADSVSHALRLFRGMFERTHFELGDMDNLFGLSLKWDDYIILIICIAIMIAVEMYNRSESIYEKIAGLNIVPRWIIYMGFLFVVILWGIYGPGFSAAAFIYQGF